MLYSINFIKNDIVSHIERKTPFSLVRVGDGDLKLLVTLIDNKVNKVKFNRNGIPHNEGDKILRLYKNACNNANYTTSFEMYYTDKFWSRKFSPGTKKKVQNWKEIYKKIGIVNSNFCNPEIGHLLFLEDVNLMSEIKGKRICLITCFRNVERMLKKKGFNVTSIIIPALNKGHYSKYRNIVKQIRDKISDVDVFLIGAGALGMGYSNVIKNNGGVSIDVGQVMNIWSGQRKAGRFKGILRFNRKTLLFKLTEKVKKFRRHL